MTFSDHTTWMVTPWVAKVWVALRPALTLTAWRHPTSLCQSVRRVICATIPVRRSQHAPPDSAATSLSDARCSSCSTARPTTCAAATNPNQRTDSLHHENGEEVSQGHMPLPLQEQDPH